MSFSTTIEYMRMALKSVSDTDYSYGKAINHLLNTYDDWKNDEKLSAFAEDIIRNTVDVETIESLMTPIDERKWVFNYDPASYWCPFETPMPESQLYDGYDHYIYIHSEVKGRYDMTYWISNNCSNGLMALPTIKAFKEYDFKVGHFYRVKCTDNSQWERNGKLYNKYYFDIEEVSEIEFMINGYIWNAILYFP